MKTIHITLAADKSLKQEQMELADLVENLNYSLSSRGTNILMVVWDCSSKHDEGTFREKVADTDLCLNLYYETFNDSSLSDLDAAFQSFCEGKNPKKIYVYFKDSDEIPENLREFRDSFPTRYGHFYCSFSNIDTLKADFLLQFIEYHANTLDGNRLVDINNGKITIDGKEYVNLQNVPFAGNNEEYNRLIRDIKKTRKLLAVTDIEDEDYMTYAKDLDDLLKIQQQMEKSLWETAMLITKLCTQQCSERLEHAMELFQSGDNKGANALLDEDAIDHDLQQNKRMIQLGKEAHKALLININEYRLKIKATQSEMAPGWSDKVIALYKKLIKVAEGYVEEAYLGELLSDYAFFLIRQRQFHLMNGLYERILKIYRELAEDNSEKHLQNLALTLNNLSVFYSQTDYLSEAELYCKESLAICRRLVEINPQNNLSGCAMGLTNLASLFYTNGKLKEAEEKYKEALTIYRHLSERGMIAFLPDVAGNLNNLGLLYNKLKKHEEAKDCYEEALSIHRQSAIKNYESNIAGLAGTLSNLAESNRCAKDLTNIEEEYKESLLLFQELAEKNPDSYLIGVAKCLNNIANFHSDIQEYTKAEKEYTESLSIRRKLASMNPKVYLSSVALGLHNLARFYHDTENFNEAEDRYNEALKIRRKLASMNYNAYIPDVASSLLGLANLYICINQYEKAEDGYEEALSIYSNLSKKTEAYVHNVLECAHNLACAYYLDKKYTIALDYAEAVNTYVISFNNLNTLACIYKALGRNEDALRTFKECLSEKINCKEPQESIKETQNKIEEVKTLIAENLNKM